jgi:hypothetical protein
MPVPDNTTAEGMAVSPAELGNLMLSGQYSVAEYQHISKMLADTADALDALREAVKPVRGIVAAADTWPKAGTVYCGRMLYYEVDAPSLQALLDAIASLLGSEEAGNGG